MNKHWEETKTNKRVQINGKKTKTKKIVKYFCKTYYRVAPLTISKSNRKKNEPETIIFVKRKEYDKKIWKKF